MQTHVERPVAPVPSTSSAAVQPLDMIPGGMWAQVGWLGQIVRNLYPVNIPRSHAIPCVGNGCDRNVQHPRLVGRMTQNGPLCHECALFLDRLAELRGQRAQEAA